MAGGNNTIMTRPKLSAARTIGPIRSATRRFTSRSSAASSVRSGNGSSTGRGCGGGGGGGETGGPLSRRGPGLARSVKEELLMETAQEYYRNHGPMTAPGACSAMLAPVPGDIAAACSTIQGTRTPRDPAPWRYDIKLSEEARGLANVRPVAAMLSQIRARSDRPLTEAREPRQRMPAVCRHFETMLW